MVLWQRYCISKLAGKVPVSKIVETPNATALPSTAKGAYDYGGQRQRVLPAQNHHCRTALYLGLLYFPKGADFRKVSDKAIRPVETVPNRRPRKTLDYETPEMLSFDRFTSLIN